MRSIALCSAVVLLICITPAKVAARPSTAASAATLRAIRGGISWQRSTAWRYQDAAFVARTPTSYAERHTRSVPYLHWIEHHWNRVRRHAKAKAARVARLLPHLRLWLCIHGTLNPYGHWEARTWDNEDTGHNGHYGGLQMHWNWGYGIMGDPAHYSAFEQMRAAELGYIASGHSYLWLIGQWNHPECMQYR